MFSKKNTDYKKHSHISDPDGNYIIVDLTIDDNRLTLVCLYGPNKDCPEFFTTIIRHIGTLNNNTSILCGDFNVVQDPDLDYYNYCGINNKISHEKILEIKENLNLIDPFREANPKLRRYTWRKKTPLKQARLDYFLMSENLLPSIDKCVIESSYRSDHSMVALHINFTKFIKGKPLWKHNNSLLSDINYLKTMNDKIKDVKKQYAVPIYNLENLHEIPNDQIQFTINDQLFLETLLMELRGKSISYSSFVKKENETQEKEIERKIEEIEHNLTPENSIALDELKDQLQTLRKHKMHGHLIRSRAKIIEEDEKPTKYFRNLETHNYANKIIPKIEKSDGTITTEQSSILKEAKQFYEHLYSNKDEQLSDINLCQELAGSDVQILTKKESDAIEGFITLKEAAVTLKSMSNNKSPGTDGFSAEFFKVFWKESGQFIVR